MTTLYTRHVSPAGAVSYRPWGAAYESASDWPAGFHLVHVAPGVTLLHRSPHDVYDEIVAALVRVVEATP